MTLESRKDTPQSSILKLTDQEVGILTAEPRDDEVDVRTDGIVYMPEIHVRARLNQAVGPGQWTLWENSEPCHVPEYNEVLYDASLIVRGVPVARARGGMRWDPKNPKRRMTFASAVESAKSECLRRCAKDLGLGAELWQLAWREEWRRKNCQLYSVRTRRGEIEREWHRRDRRPWNRVEDAHGGRRGRPDENPTRDARRTGTGPAAPRPPANVAQPPSAVINQPPLNDQSIPPLRPGGITERQRGALKRLLTGLSIDTIQTHLQAHGVGRIEDLSSRAASELITWAQSQHGT